MSPQTIRLLLALAMIFLWVAGSRAAQPMAGVAGSVIDQTGFERGVRDGYVRDLEHPDHPLSGDDVTAARGQLLVVLDGERARAISGVLHVDLAPDAGTRVTADAPGGAA